jgi:hypothetical protein
MSRDGIAIVDFSALPEHAGATTTNGARELVAALTALAFADPGVAAVEYRLNGSCSKFWATLQAACQRLER